DRYLYDHRCTPNYETRACPAANLAVATLPLEVTAPRMGDILQSWGHSPSRGTGTGGGYEAIYFKKDPNEPVPCGGCYDGVLANFNAGVCVTKADGTPLFPQICAARMAALENCDKLCKTYDGPVNGVYHGGAETLRKDAAAVGY
ncbi:MAG: hypothetical protein FWF95_05175, partial [Syntrophorhabdaceae bacterium]|nr:hypothetical protein [Syntrophorhabdaceae bacterium]